MASHGYRGHNQGSPQYAEPMPMAGSSQAPSGTFQPGTKIQVGGHRVVIQKYLSEGGFAHVYVVKLQKPVDGTDLAVLKRVAVPDKDSLRGMRTEVETMKRLKGHKPIVTYIDSHASEIQGGGYEVFLLMEYCDGSGLIDFMNTRLQHRLTEPEIIKIFADVAEGVACMHYLKPTLLHRDLKVENVLITGHGSSKRFKLCDFGSAAPPKPAPTSIVECRLLDEDIQRHTTMQYRSPEMVDVYRKQPINEKADIWALGVLLYKLCYYTTPFEQQGQLAILNASFKYPSHPVFSDRLKKLIGSMLRENYASRPNIYQVVKEACAMQGREVLIDDIYSSSQASSREKTHSSSSNLTSPPAKVGAVFAAPRQEQQSLPDVVPMRRGRPAASSGANHSTHQPSASPMRVTEGDPFAALDSKSPAQATTNEFTSRFPSLDQFSLLHDHGSKFDFDSSPRNTPTASQNDRIANQRLSERLAGEAFASSSSSRSPPTSRQTSRPRDTAPIVSPPTASITIGAKSAPSLKEVSRAQAIISGNAELRAISDTNSRYVSTGTSTADLPSERIPHESALMPTTTGVHARSSSLARVVQKITGQQSTVDQRTPAATRIVPVTSSDGPARLASSFDPVRQPMLLQPDYDELPASASRRQRPISASYDTSTLDFLRENEASGRSGQPSPRLTPQPLPSPGPPPLPGQDKDLTDLNIATDSRRIDNEDESMLTKGTLSGRFSNAFKRFENDIPDLSRAFTHSSSLLKQDLRPDRGRASLDVAVQQQPYDREDVENDMTPEQRRDIEKAQLEEEERRVQAGQAEYRRKVTEVDALPTQTPLPRSIGGVSRAVSIQNRVHNLLQEGQQPASVQRIAEGYGKYSDAATAASKVLKTPKSIPRKPLAISKTRTEPVSSDTTLEAPAKIRSSPVTTRSSVGPRPGPKPPAPKKPLHLNSIPTGSRTASPPKRAPSGRLEQLIAADLPGQPVLDMTDQEKDAYLQDFSKRFPSLGAIEMAETDLGAEQGFRRG